MLITTSGAKNESWATMRLPIVASMEAMNMSRYVLMCCTSMSIVACIMTLACPDTDLPVVGTLELLVGVSYRADLRGRMITYSAVPFQ